MHKLKKYSLVLEYANKAWNATFAKHILRWPGPPLKLFNRGCLCRTILGGVDLSGWCLLEGVGGVGGPLFDGVVGGEKFSVFICECLSGTFLDVFGVTDSWFAS